MRRLAPLLALALAACAGPTPPPLPPEAPPIAVSTAIATTRSAPTAIVATGTVEPLRRVSPGTKLLGRVAEVLVDDGDRVAAGELLARLESRDLEAAVDQARAGVAMAEAELGKAERQATRMEGLASRGSATAKAHEDATAAHRVAVAALDRARADLRAATATLAYAEIRTPIAGRVAARRIEPGDMATPGAPLFTVEDLARLEIALVVSESEVAAIAPGQRVRVETLGRELDGEVAQVVPAGDAASRTFTVLVEAENPGGEILGGAFARTSFPGPERPALRVPATALVRRGQLDGVFVVGEDGRARLRWVEVGETADGGVEVRSGLADGERVVITPPAGLADGAAVAIEGGRS